MPNDRDVFLVLQAPLRCIQKLLRKHNAKFPMTAQRRTQITFRFPFFDISTTTAIFDSLVLASILDVFNNAIAIGTQ